MLQQSSGPSGRDQGNGEQPSTAAWHQLMATDPDQRWQTDRGGQAHCKERRGKQARHRPVTTDSRQLSSLLCWEGKVTVVLTYCTVTRLAGNVAQAQALMLQPAQAGAQQPARRGRGKRKTNRREFRREERDGQMAVVLVLDQFPGRGVVVWWWLVQEDRGRVWNALPSLARIFLEKRISHAWNTK